MPSRDILLVDDEPDIRRIGQLTLERLGGHRVRLAASGPEALDALRTAVPEVVLLDVMLPGMDGPTTLQAIRKLPCAVPVIFVTAKVQRHEVEQYLAAGALGVIKKPFDPLGLPGEVEALLTGSKRP